MSTHRARWAALGAALAITIGGGGIGIVGATTSSGERTVFVSTTPCRLLDTRPGVNTVGPRTAPIGAADTYTVAAHGSNGDCAGIPADAVALSLNVTALGATELTFISVWPSDEGRPDGSSLNPSNGQPPTPNAVTTRLSPTGEFNIYNHVGSVNVIVDVNGYYVDHDHDDRYYTRDEVNALIPQQQRVTKYMAVAPAAFAPRYATNTAFTEYQNGSSGELFVTGGTQDQMYAPVFLPDGAVVEALHVWVTDSTAASNLDVRLAAIRYDGGFSYPFGVLSGSQPVPTKLTDTGSMTVDNENRMYKLWATATINDWGDYGSSLQLEGVTIEYTVLE